MSFLRDMATLRRLLFTRVHGDTHQARLDTFYQGQAAGYDDFRKRLLQGREALIEHLPLEKGGVWVDLGGGTGANLSMAGQRLQIMEQVWIVDLCPALAEVARQRVRAAGWQNVEVLVDDACSVALPIGQADIVTFSYALTMIPDWHRAIEQALRLLRPGGVLGVVDFYVSRKYVEPGDTRHGWLHRTFWPVWFAHDNVFLSPDHLPYLRDRCPPIYTRSALAKVPYFPVLRVPYYQYVGQKAQES